MKKVVVIGSLNIDTVIDVEHMPVAGETISADKVELIPGGKGANQAYTIGKLGGNVTMLGCAGDDTHAKIVLDSLKSAGVDISHIKKDKNESTGNAIVTVNKEGNNSIIIIHGANYCADIPYIEEKIDIIEQSDIVVLQLEIPLNTVMYVAKKAKAMGKTVILDPAPAIKDLPDELLKCVDIIKPNETELKMLLKDENADKDLSKSADLLMDKGVANVLITLGGNGAYLKCSDKNQYRLHSVDVEVVDTTAAGDSFTGAVAYSLSNGEDVISAIKFADRVATVTVTKKGAQSSIPSLREVEDFFERINFDK